MEINIISYKLNETTRDSCVLDEKPLRRKFFLHPDISLDSLWAALLNWLPTLCLSNASTLTLGLTKGPPALTKMNNWSVENSFYCPHFLSTGPLQHHHNWIPCLSIIANRDYKLIPKGNQTSPWRIPLISQIISWQLLCSIS